jgi:hypothetical protein
MNGTDMKLNTLQAKETDEDSHYQKTQFDMNTRSASLPPTHTIAPPEGVVITGAGVSYSTLQGRDTQAKAPGGTTQHEASPGIDEAGYSDVEILTFNPKSNHYDTAAAKSDTYDDVIGMEASNGQYSTVDHSISKKPDSTHPKEIPYSVVLKNGPPLVPPKTPELYRDLKREGKMAEQKAEAEGEHYAEVGENLKRGLLASQVGVSSSSADADNQEAAYYSTIKDSTKPPPSVAQLGDFSELEGGSLKADDVYSEVDNVLSKKQGSIVISNSALGDMEDSRLYDSAEILAKPQGDGTVYANLDSPMATGENVYDAVYSEPIKPSMFVKSPERDKKTADHNGEDEGVDEEEDEEAVYAPIYSLTTSMNSSNLLQVKPENIHKIKTLGTGFFGKVLLADTVGLSLKDLNMSETDDDKTKSVRVAVKTLRHNPSPVRRETFEKELKFMSRLSHPNVVRTLGACTSASPFIVMEYMEKGDLRGYLLDFDSITNGSAPPTNLTISVGTLTYMCTQVADAMKYLASRNYIHRDLATRNCLVGDESRIKIADFGMSKNLYQSHYYVIKGHAVLPVRWMARECFYGKFSPKTDVWAFGVTMWEIFTLAKDIPYEDMDDSEVAADGSKKSGDRTLLERPKDCPEDLYSVMLMCWATEPEDRATFDKLHQTLSSIKPKD